MGSAFEVEPHRAALDSVERRLGGRRRPKVAPLLAACEAGMSPSMSTMLAAGVSEGTKGQMDGHFPAPLLLICRMGSRMTACVPAKTQRAPSKTVAAGQGLAGAGQGLAGSLPCHLRLPGRPPGVGEGAWGSPTLQTVPGRVLEQDSHA